ncbi:hypothetical protein CR155_06310 [Pollutimonas nitritireducens]|uniref:Uncharacterized protein n=1 Tax=Pollutimonas nitritireducens TaxID=2045209 RepID=A0A2N4UJ74_9BURK|nr:hypothetical protein CR155_06310 [Pollutimonas nitritireducens]
MGLALYLVYKIQIPVNNRQEASRMQELSMLHHTINVSGKWLTIDRMAKNHLHLRMDPSSNIQNNPHILYTK